jgi:hypothetical protein
MHIGMTLVPLLIAHSAPVNPYTLGSLLAAFKRGFRWLVARLVYTNEEDGDERNDGGGDGVSDGEGGGDRGIKGGGGGVIDGTAAVAATVAMPGDRHDGSGNTRFKTRVLIDV